MNNLNRTMLRNYTRVTAMKNNSYSKIDEINTRSQKPTKSFLPRRHLNEVVKKNLDSFSMVRRQYNIPISNYESVPISNVKRKISSLETNEFSNDVRELEDKKIINVLSKQTVLMEKLAEVLEMEHQAMRTEKKKKEKKEKDFDSLLRVMEERKNTTKKQPSTTVKQKKLSTIMTVMDETEIRKALRGDPLVKRILKMAERKRSQYLEAAKKYFNS